MSICKRGFTLIELLIVMIIVGILATIAIPALQTIIRKAIISEAMINLHTIINAEKAYYLECGEYGRYDQLQDAGLIKLRLGAPTPEKPCGYSDLDGTYFSEECYVFNLFDYHPTSGIGTARFEFYPHRPAEWKNLAPRADATSSWDDGWVFMDTNGKIYSNFKWLGYPES